MGVLDGKVAVVAGASRGIGKGIALELGDAGATVYACGRTLDPRGDALGSLSEAARIFDASHLESIIHELAAQAIPLSKGREAEALKGLTAVDGSIFAALPRMAWALECCVSSGQEVARHRSPGPSPPCTPSRDPSAAPP